MTALLEARPASVVAEHFLQSDKEEENVDSIIGLLIFVAAGYWLFRHGKHIGSRKGFGVGINRGRRQHRRRSKR